ncbi:ribosomal-protein-alanine N-acetyltransferase RimI [Malaciobacter pacificus]|uniref:Ribosomal-protein-S18-alanine N-acetyltransferase n=1 Tax=Malaciobacter pacificus TaxID=1080223 RepID=A0A5C2H8U5_9BACT|nr:GNAT family N-acetyltransferase [Malaciobacter pacificus]QEP33875.1 ribosomal-protein-S18-alanine N-acetyltransferase [Malaciobacter pacificus]GGD34807.1 ribosomal-protein-alanine N-acetyltransferase RimI [Malaciobacter pacificus]
MIEIATTKDLNTLFDIENRVFANDSFALSKNSLRYHLSNNIIYKIEQDEKIAGYILWLKRKNYYRLYSLAIHPDFRGLGLASRLLEYSLENLDKEKFSLEVKVSNLDAIRLYKKFGFKVSRILKDYYEDIDGYLMVK